MTGRFEGEVAVVTGGSSGIGLATAVAFAAEGAHTVVADMQVDEGEQVVRTIRSSGGEATFLRTDVSSTAEVEAMVAHALETHGRLDCAFNNAGIEGDMASTFDCTEENWRRTLDVNLTACGCA